MEPTALDVLAQLLGYLGTIALFAGGGALYALSGYSKNSVAGDDSFDWGRAKYPVVLGAGAGVVVLVTGGTVEGTGIEAAAMLLAILADQFRQMVQSGDEKYDELREQGVDQSEAAMRSLQHAIDQSNPEKALAAVHAYTNEHGQPSADNVRERTAGVQESAQEGGVEQVVQEHTEADPEDLAAGLAPVDEGVDDSGDGDSEADTSDGNGGNGDDPDPDPHPTA